MFRRVERFCALWLIAQVLLPFTAPFPICDPSDLFGDVHHQGAPLAPLDAHTDGDYAVAPPLVTTAGRLKLVVVSSPHQSPVEAVLAATPARRPESSVGSAQPRSQTQPTVLRL